MIATVAQTPSPSAPTVFDLYDALHLPKTYTHIVTLTRGCDEVTVAVTTTKDSFSEVMNAINEYKRQHKLAGYRYFETLDVVEDWDTSRWSHLLSE